MENLDFDLRALLSDTLESFQEPAKTKGLDVVHTVADDVPAGITGDPTYLRQILVNLLGNAVKFTHKGEVKLAVGINRKAGGGPRLLFRVSDNGIGIAEDMINSLFGDSTPADGSASGAGLGLAASKRHVNMMGGEIGVQSRVGEGSMFYFWLPLVETASDVTSGPSGTATPGDPPSRPLNILVAEDNKLNQRIISAILDKFGFTFDIVGDGAEAVKQVTMAAYDLILMDVRMPEMSGPDASRAIRQMTDDARDIPIIALTADGIEKQVQGYIEAGMNGFVAKPIDPLAMLAEINKVVGK